MAPPVPPDEFGSLARDVLAAGHSFRFTARGASMVPFIRDGDILTVVPLPVNSLRRGDVALYLRADGRPVAHRVRRVVNRGPAAVLEAGPDSRADPPETVPESRYLGTAFTRERRGRVTRLRPPWRRLAPLLWIACHPLGLCLLRAARGLKARPGLPVAHKSEHGTQTEDSTPNIQQGISNVQGRERNE